MPPQSVPTLGNLESGANAPPLFTWEQVGAHSGQMGAKQDLWLVINRKVYDISNFYRRHPGGSRIIKHYAGQDATVRFFEGGTSFSFATAEGCGITANSAVK